MIALRGIVYKDDQSRWRWSGLWSFGPLPLNVGRDRESLKTKVPNARPVEFTWEKPIDASTVEIPFLVLQNGIDNNEENSATNNETSEEQQEIEAKRTPAEDNVCDVSNVGDSLISPTYSSTNGPETMPNTGIASDQQGNQSGSDDFPQLPSGALDESEIVTLPPGSKEKSNVVSEPFERGITFSSMSEGDPVYTEASTLLDCPPDGSWVGYFENVIRGRKADNRVSETVSLFWNATPPKHARSAFLDDNNGDCELESEKIHVRGMGTNQFGVFELIGSFDMMTKVLELQRMYVSTTEPLAPRPSPPPKVTPSRKAPASRSYSTRKRKLSWQRRSTLSDDEDEIVGMHRHLGPSKKKSRVTSTNPTTAEKVSAQAASSQPKTAAADMYSSVENTSKVILSTALSTIAQGPTKRRGSQNNQVALKSSSPPSSPHDVVLPAVGDPDEARWRAAHFFYYQRNDQTIDENAAATSFVVYEGEMLHGKCMRHGRGVCLFNDGTIYEGDWRRNREHGKGTLMTSDRRRIIYKGEWERGRMHGQGIYYFSPWESGIFPTTAQVTISGVIPRYEGEFKENSRHGNGKYFLPDGSTYEGEWRENLMSGRGFFVWPDGSTYIGQWKDGKRHGQGLLRVADKFTYDGMWVNNAMEGRGIAEYPGGQKYEGLWANGRRDGRGTIQFINGAMYEGRFRDDAIEGQGTMKMTKAVTVPSDESGDLEEGWMIPISFQSDMGRIHQKAGFTLGGE